ncbi:VOC family protein [Bacillus sp. ISL-35]|uniref:VOC family protein n=1 Tax=Bacillus sp. ISL-35 TaxID=2819122 RepID=UPI001BEA65B8|nr:VOC family protein [Bacillus sp. ISL-35]MBT2680219.1 VOC family protein [Bacillus sp. ISL-35]MBT2704495.1 VOC family protein [Chryseobacterium sp. ISL-80]
MQFFFDHLVWFFKKPEKAISPLNQRGLHVVQGGRHETWGTYNTLTYFGLSYIEFLGIENLSIAEKHDENRLITQIVEQLAKENREGPATVAIRTNQIEELAIKLKAEGLTVYGPLTGERVRADGQVIRWSLLFPEYAENKVPLPFFIQWEKSDDERFAELEELRVIGSHIVGHPKLESVGFVVNDLDKTPEIWRELFGLKQGEEYIDTELNALCRILELDKTNLLFITPIGDGPAAKVLKEKGETPFLVNLTDTNQSQFFELLDGYWRFR